MIKNNLIYVLGAQDPEMREIERILLARKCTVYYAGTSFSRCNSGDAYSVNCVISRDLKPALILPSQAYVAIECNLSAIIPSVIIDHHNPGDPGFSCGPADFMAGSSLGQILEYFEQEATADQRLLCAADHCLTAAYAGMCPGVDQDDLLFSRAAWQAHINKRSLTDVISGIYAAAALIKKKVDSATGIADFTDITPPQDLPEASALVGIPVRYKKMSFSGETKEMLKGGSFSQINAFMAEGQNKGLRVYGNPYRGYAGMYLA